MIIRKDYLVSARINIGNFLDDQAAPEAAFIELKETDIKVAMRLTKAKDDNEQLFGIFLESFPEILVDHDLMKSETEKCSAAEVATIIGSRVELFTHVMKEYKEKVLFSPGRKAAAS